MVVELEGFGVARGVQLPQFSGADEFFGEEDGEAEDLVEHGGEVGVVIAGVLGELA